MPMPFFSNSIHASGMVESNLHMRSGISKFVHSDLLGSLRNLNRFTKLTFLNVTFMRSTMWIFYLRTSPISSMIQWWNTALSFCVHYSDSHDDEYDYDKILCTVPSGAVGDRSRLQQSIKAYLLTKAKTLDVPWTHQALRHLILFYRVAFFRHLFGFSSASWPNLRLRWFLDPVPSGVLSLHRAVRNPANRGWLFLFWWMKALDIFRSKFSRRLFACSLPHTGQGPTINGALTWRSYLTSRPELARGIDPWTINDDSRCFLERLHSFVPYQHLPRFERTASTFIMWMQYVDLVMLELCWKNSWRPNT